MVDNTKFDKQFGLVDHFMDTERIDNTLTVPAVGVSVSTYVSEIEILGKLSNFVVIFVHLTLTIAWSQKKIPLKNI